MEGFIGFFGHKTITLDEKFRVRIPTCYRESLGARFFLCKAPGGCIWVLSQEEYEKLANVFRSVPASDKNAQTRARHFFSSVESPEEDKQGRFVISQKFREFAQMDKKVEFVGNGDKLEMWGGYYDGDTEDSEGTFAGTVEDIDNMFAEMADYGL